MLIECHHCGAPLDVEDDRQKVTCAYCEAPNRVQQTRMLARIPPPGWTPPNVWTPPPHVKAPSKPLRYRRVKRAVAGGAIMALVALFFLVNLGLAFWPELRRQRWWPWRKR